MAEGSESIEASTPATDETITPPAVADAYSTEDKTAAASASTDSEPAPGEKRKADDDGKPEADDSSTKKAGSSATEATNPKKAKIAMPPPVSASLMDVEKYELEVPPPENNTNEADVTKKITTANLMLFGLHPLIREGPLKKMLEDYGSVQAITVRSAFASRYGHVSFATVEEARKCYVAIHGAKLLHKAFLVQPSMASAVAPKTKSSSKVPVASSAGAAASAAVAASTKSDLAPPASDSAGAAAAAAAAAVTTTSA